MGAESAASPVDGNVPAGIAPSLAPWLFNGGRWSGPSRHLLGGARSSQTPAHAAPVQPLPWVCRSRPSAAPSVTAPSSLLLRSCQPQPQTLALRSFLPSLQGGLVREAAVGRRRRGVRLTPGLRVPHPRLALRAKAGWLQASSKVIRVGDAP